MAGEDAEKKTIAKLDFNVKDATDNLEEVAKKLEKLSTDSEKSFEKIEKNFDKAFSGGDYSKQIKEMQDKLLKFEQLSQKNQEKMTVSLNKEINKRFTKQQEFNQKLIIEDKKKNDRLEVEDKKLTTIKEKEEEKRQTAAYKSMLKQEEYNNRLAQSTESLYDKITQYAKTYVIYQGFNELRKGIQETIDEMVEVEQRMVAIDRVMNITGMDVNAFRDDLIQLAADYGNAFNNVADISLRLAQAGIKGENNLKLTEKTLLALNTAELDATQATDDMVAVMSQWNLITDDATQTAKSYGEIIDRVNKVADNYPTTSADIMDALKKVSSAFNLAGASIDETIATIVAAEKASQRGGKVIGTALSNITQQLKAEGKLDLAEQLGLDFFEDDAKTKFKPIMEIFQEMAERMATLKEQGKESSTEMQSLLELFTVFRRNIGASLLGEMSGEDNTYLSALTDSLNSAGYSLQENEKYMKTAKAAQEQFNAELLKLKTEIWDNQLESVFREMLSFGKDFVGGLRNLIDVFGILPTTVATATAAFSVFGKKIDYNSLKKYTENLKDMKNAINLYNSSTTDGYKKMEAYYNLTGKKMPEALKNYTGSLKGAEASMTGLTTKTVIQTAKQIGLNLAVAATEAAISFGLSLAIQAIITAIIAWINKTEDLIKEQKELMETAQGNAEKIEEERKSLEKLTSQLDETIKKYEELDETDVDKTETTTELYELQTKINEALEGTGKRVNIINESLDEQGKAVIKINEEWQKQIKLLDSVAYDKKVKEVKELQEAMEAANKKNVGISTNLFDDTIGIKTSQLMKAGVNLYDKNSQFYKDVAEQNAYSGFKMQTGINLNPFELDNKNPLNYLQDLDVEGQTKYLNEWISALELAKNKGEDVEEALTFLKGKLKEIEEQEKDVTNTTEAYNNAMKELYGDTYRLIGYQSALQDIMDTYGEDETVRVLIDNLENLNIAFANGEITYEEYFDGLKSQIASVTETIAQNGGAISEGLQAVFAETTKYVAEGIDDAIKSYEDGTSTFSEYQDALAKSTESLLELYAAQKNLTYDEENNEWWDNQNQRLDTYATSLQETTDAVEVYSNMLRQLGDSYDYIAEHADAAGNAAFTAEEVGTESFTNVANSLADNLANMRQVNYAEWQKITGDMGIAAEQLANEEMNVDAYVKDALLTSEENLNNTLANANNSAQDTTAKLGKSTGDILSKLGDVISGFDYEIKGQPFINGDLGLEFDEHGFIKKLKLPSFGFNVTGTGGNNVKLLGESLKTFGTDVGTYFASGSHKSLLQNINPYKSSLTNPVSSGSPSSTSTTPTSSGGGGGSGSGGSSSRESTSRQETEQEKDDYKERLAAFKAYITEKERLEKRWVDKQKELGLLSNDDYLYITQQRIERYKEYIQAVEDATWIHEEDKLELEKEYMEKIEDLQVDYLGYLKDKLNDEISALKKANSEKIEIIKDEATERINALKAVEKENDRIRKKEEYEKNRAKHLEDISYWEQRSGRQAQEALKEAKEKLNELDEEWQKQMEDWSIEDQIKAIEEERDAQIKAIEETQEAEIKALEAAYDAKVKLYAETGELIYENSVIQSKALFNQYKNNFIDPIKNEIEELNKTLAIPATSSESTTQTSTNSQPVAAAPETAPEPVQDYETYVIQWGDTLTSIARRFGTTIEDILEANPYVTNRNKIYAGRTLEIPKFHEGGIVGGSKEAYALLKPQEVILKPEWASSLNRMMKYFDNVTTGKAMNNVSGTNIEVAGDLLKIDAQISNKADADYLVKRVEKILKDKFNVNK